MTARMVRNDDWFFVPRTKKWYQKVDTGNMYTTAFQIGSSKVHMIDNEEPVVVRK